MRWRQLLRLCSVLLDYPYHVLGQLSNHRLIADSSRCRREHEANVEVESVARVLFVVDAHRIAEDLVAEQRPGGEQ